MSGLDRSLTVLVVAVFLAATQTLHADTVTATLDAGLGTDVLVGTIAAGVESFTYTNTATVIEVLGVVSVVDLFVPPARRPTSRSSVFSPPNGPQ